MADNESHSINQSAGNNATQIGTNQGTINVDNRTSNNDYHIGGGGASSGSDAPPAQVIATAVLGLVGAAYFAFAYGTESFGAFLVWGVMGFFAGGFVGVLLTYAIALIPILLIVGVLYVLFLLSKCAG
jgi:hypothetical protein